MNKPLTEKEKLVSLLTQIYENLEEVEQGLAASFSDLRTHLNNDELNKISVSEQKLANIENKFKRSSSASMIGIGGKEPFKPRRPIIET